MIALPAIDSASERATYRSARQEKAAIERRVEKSRGDDVVVGLPWGTDASNWIVVSVVVLAAGAGILIGTRKPTR